MRTLGNSIKRKDMTTNPKIEVSFSVRGDRSEIERNIARVRQALSMGVSEADIPGNLNISPEDAFLCIHAAKILDRP